MNGAEKLREFLKASKRPMAAIARVTGIHETRLSEFKRGARRPTLEQAVLIEDATLGAVLCRDWTQE